MPLLSEIISKKELDEMKEVVEKEERKRRLLEERRFKSIPRDQKQLMDRDR